MSPSFSLQPCHNRPILQSGPQETAVPNNSKNSSKAVQGPCCAWTSPHLHKGGGHRLTAFYPISYLISPKTVSKCLTCFSGGEDQWSLQSVEFFTWEHPPQRATVASEGVRPHSDPQPQGKGLLRVDRIGLILQNEMTSSASAPAHEPYTIRQPAGVKTGTREQKQIWEIFSGCTTACPTVRFRISRPSRKVCSAALDGKRQRHCQVLVPVLLLVLVIVRVLVLIVQRTPHSLSLGSPPHHHPSKTQGRGEGAVSFRRRWLLKKQKQKVPTLIKKSTGRVAVWGRVST